MLPTQRRQAILAEVRQAKAVSAEDLARRYGVSLETIRRDLRGLRDQGLLERVYGGALSVRSTEGDFATRSTLHAARKQAIAQLAATLVEPEDTLGAEHRGEDGGPGRAAGRLRHLVQELVARQPPVPRHGVDQPPVGHHDDQAASGDLAGL